MSTHAEPLLRDPRDLLAQFAPAELTADLAGLPVTERCALDAVIAAADLVHAVFLRQVWPGNPARRDVLSRDLSPEGEARLRYFDLMAGPWDRQAGFSPFAVDHAHPPGGGFYPEDLGPEELRAWCAAHPGQAEDLKSLTTVIRRDGAALRAVPYREAWGELLGAAAARLREAAALTANPSLRAFLAARADALLTDDYYASDLLWMDVDAAIEVTLGPYETYEDELLGLKASYGAFVTVADPAASARLDRFKTLLPEMEQGLPVPDEVKTARGGESPIRVADVVYMAGDARAGCLTMAFNLPNDERVRAEKGAKKVMLRNVIRQKFERIMVPIAQAVLAEDQLPLLSADAFFDWILCHELSHSLGPAFTRLDGQEVEVRIALGVDYAPLEEAKADAMGVYDMLFMIDRGELPAELRPQVLVSYLVGLIRSVRFGVGEAHGLGANVQLGRHLAAGGARIVDGRLRVDLPALEASVLTLVRDICLLQHEGDQAGTRALLHAHAQLPDGVEDLLARLGDIPVDLRPIFPLAS